MSLKKINTINELLIIISKKMDVQQNIDGKMYNISFITMLNLKLIQLMQMISDGKLFYEEIQW